MDFSIPSSLSLLARLRTVRVGRLRSRVSASPEPIAARSSTDLGDGREHEQGGRDPGSAAQSVRPARTSATQARATTKSLSLVPAGTTTGRASSLG